MYDPDILYRKWNVSRPSENPLIESLNFYFICSKTMPSYILYVSQKGTVDWRAAEILQ